MCQCSTRGERWRGICGDPGILRLDDANAKPTHSRFGNTCSRTAHNGRASRGLCGQLFLKKPASSPAPPGRTSIAELLADERCSQAVLQFFATTDVGRTSGPPVAEDGEDAASEASEWEARDQAARAWERREEVERLGAE